MASKTFIINQADGQRVPFLRGILVQSLVAIGLSFREAYAVAQEVREELADVEEITSSVLHKRVSELLGRRFESHVRHAYVHAGEKKAPILVKTTTRQGPFSVGILARYLEGCAIEREEALAAATTVYAVLSRAGHREIDSMSLRGIVYQSLKEKNDKAANRYLSRRRFEDSGEPLILLVGGGTGAGKSTVTTELAYRLEIVRTQSTDMMREIIRSYLAPQVVPTLAYSSFEAWRGLPVDASEQKVIDHNPVVTGFLSQFATVKAALEATVVRAVKERQDLIVDGVHVLPTKLDLNEVRKHALVIPVMLAVTTPEQLMNRLSRRGREQPDRNRSRQAEQIEKIWELQSYILNLADQAGIPIVCNWSVEATVGAILNEVIERISERYPPQPDELL